MAVAFFTVYARVGAHIVNKSAATDSALASLIECAKRGSFLLLTRDQAMFFNSICARYDDEVVAYLAHHDTAEKQKLAAAFFSDAYKYAHLPAAGAVEQSAAEEGFELARAELEKEEKKRRRAGSR
jgi:hypothetical protein